MGEIIIIGNVGCSRCITTKNILDSKNISYRYVMLDDLKQEEQNKYFEMAKEKGIMSLPLMIRDEKLITLQEV